MGAIEVTLRHDEKDARASTYIVDKGGLGVRQGNAGTFTGTQVAVQGRQAGECGPDGYLRQLLAIDLWAAPRMQNIAASS